MLDINTIKLNNNKFNLLKNDKIYSSLSQSNKAQIKELGTRYNFWVSEQIYSFLLTFKKIAKSK